MRPIIFSLFFLFCATLSLAQSLSRTISLSLENVPIQVAIDQVSAQSGFRFAYNPDIFSDKKVTVNVQNKPVDQVLEMLLGAGYTYKVRGSYLIILPERTESKKSPMSIEGQVVDAGTGRELSNVSVYEVSSLRSVLTDGSGRYAISASLPNEVAFLAVSRENYADTIVEVSPGEGVFTVFLRPIKEKIREQKPALDSLRAFRLFVNKKLKQHEENVSLEEMRFAQLALVPGVSTNGVLAGKVSNHFSVNLIAGYSYSLAGVELGGVLNMERMRASGVQLSGALNIVGDYFEGVQAAGFSNVVLQEVTGVQMAGFSNHSGVLKGVQLGGFMNTATESSGAQVAGFANFHKGTFKGIQLAGFLNQTTSLKGIQLGVVNIAGSVESGVPIGLVSWVKDGLHQMEAGANDVTPYNLSFRSGIEKFYSIITAGIDPTDKNLWSYGLGFGSQWRLSDRLAASLEATQNTLQPIDEGYMDGYNGDLRAGLRLGLYLTERISLHGGPVFHYFVLTPTDAEDLDFADRFGKKPIFDAGSAKTAQKGWLGFEVSVRF